MSRNQIGTSIYSVSIEPMTLTQDIDEAIQQVHAIRSSLSKLITSTNMNPKITDYAHLIERNKDITLYQHASTLQLFQTIAQADGKLELFIFNGGVWHSERIGANETIVDMVANPD
jgi:hypothetical protein